MRFFPSLALLACMVKAAGASAQTSCTPPTGLGTLPTEVTSAITGALSSGTLPYLWIPLAFPFIGEIVKFETPIQFRLAQIHGSSVYNVAAKYHPHALNIWGQDTNRICQDGDQEALKLHNEVAIAYAFYYSAVEIVPWSKPVLQPILESFGILVSNLDIEPVDPSTPWGLAKIVVDEMTASVVEDGWNADGSLSNDYNELPYSDFDLVGENGEVYSKYKVKAKKKKKKNNNSNSNQWHWQPLLESDGKGYFTKQEHVTPFCGFTGRLYGMNREYYNSFTSPKPIYDYKKEARYVLRKTKKMASNDLQKMMLEYYDSKFTSILPLQIDWSIKSGMNNFDFWYNDMVLVNTMYDATLLVWKEKVVHNAVRPTTVVHELVGEEKVETYAGPFKGVDQVKGTDWQPFVRTMPHAEYPSGSACICTAFAETLQLMTGTDDIAIPLTADFVAGSSKTEPGVTPAMDITVTYTKWSEIAKDCGLSRLYGGMHFKDSITAGNELCSGFVGPVVNNAELLLAGNSRGAFFERKNKSGINVSPGAS
eukprot:jgi/Psemu1/70504/estExt_Genemark1.C_23710002